MRIAGARGRLAGYGYPEQIKMGRIKRLLSLCVGSALLMWVLAGYQSEIGSLDEIEGMLGVYQEATRGQLWRVGIVLVLAGFLVKVFVKQVDNQGLFGKGGKRRKGGSVAVVGDEELGAHKIGAHFGREVEERKSLGGNRGGKSGMVTGEVESKGKTLGKAVEARSERCLLAPRCVESREKKLTVVLDLDDTLLMARRTKEVPGNVLDAIDSGLLTASRTNFMHGKTEMDLTIVLRPGVKKFLEKLVGFAEVIIFTAGSAAYANPLIDCLDASGSLLSGRLFRCSTVKTRYQEYVKDMSLLGRNLGRTVLLDDKPFSGLLQPYNVIPCAPFMGDHRDHQLLTSYLPLLEHLNRVQDVRPVLKEVFQMHSYMTEWGVQESFIQKCLENPGDTQKFILH